MDYEERMIDGVQMVAFQGHWYPLYEDEPDYDEKVEDGMVMILVNGQWFPVMEAVQDFPFAELSDDELNALYDVYEPGELTGELTTGPYYECDDDDDMQWIE
jgi:hypothetical protein